MGLGAGDRLGPYEVVALLGTGGMGEVYQARDSRLNRQVAVKILSEDGRFLYYVKGTPRGPIWRVNLESGEEILLS